MLKEIILPKQGLQMTEGTITKWIVREGEDAKEGEPLFEMETDKLTITIDSTATGKLLKIVRGEGETVPITEIIAYVGDEADKASIPADAAKAAPQVAAPAPEAPKAAPTVETPKKEEPKVIEKKEEPAEPKKSKVKATAATPRAKTFAEMYKINMDRVSPTGPDGLIIARDVVKFAESHSSASAASFAVISVNLKKFEAYVEQLGEDADAKQFAARIAEKAFAKSGTFDCPAKEDISVKILSSVSISVNTSGDIPAITFGAKDECGNAFVSFVYEEGSDEDADKFLGIFKKFIEVPVLAFI